MNVIQLPTLRIEMDVLDVTPFTIRDESWEYRDAKGHLHRWRKDKEGNFHLPSLKEVVDCPGDDEYPAIWHYECKRCGVEIFPGHKPSPRQDMMGLKHYYVNDAEVDKHTFDEWVDAIQRFCQQHARG